MGQAPGSRTRQLMIRQIVLDTETTGLDPDSGDRIVEIGALELINHMPTERSFHTYINPERRMSPGASEISGITDEMLIDKPRFVEVADQFLEFIADSELIIHNAAFDIRFLNAELAKISEHRIPDERTFCTLIFARRKYPGAPASLDALCRRFNIDLSARVKHGALIDARLLADVYLELIGGRQPGFLLVGAQEQAIIDAGGAPVHRQRVRPTPLPSLLSQAELAAHQAFILAELGERPLWRLVA